MEQCTIILFIMCIVDPIAGTLCGTCVNGTGVGVLRTNCRDCDKENYFSLAFLSNIFCCFQITYTSVE